jgi:hypothetical protein
MVENQYGIENVKFAVAPATDLIEAIYKLLKEKLSVISVVNAFTGIAFNLAVYRKVIETRAQILLEFRDLNPTESIQLAQAFKTEFDIQDDIQEAKVERLVLAAAEFYSMADPLILSAKDILQGDHGLSYKIRGGGDIAKDGAYLVAWAIDVIDEVGDLIELKIVNNPGKAKDMTYQENPVVSYGLIDDSPKAYRPVKN